MARRLAVIAAFLLLTSCLLAGQGLELQAPSSQGAIVGQSYTLPLTVTGGTPPYSWHLAGGELPPGCKLHKHEGKISGAPSTPGEYHFTIAVADSSIPKLEVQRELTIRVIAGLAIEWKDAPTVQGTMISGSAIVTNETPENFDLTVVIVAVNQIGRATTLGYQHIKLAAGTSSPVVPFGSAPGPGTYYVRADAVAQRSGHHHVYRASKETTSAITVTQF